MLIECVCCMYECMLFVFGVCVIVCVVSVWCVCVSLCVECVRFMYVRV